MQELENIQREIYNAIFSQMLATREAAQSMFKIDWESLSLIIPVEMIRIATAALASFIPYEKALEVIEKTIERGMEDAARSKENHPLN